MQKKAKKQIQVQLDATLATEVAAILSEIGLTPASAITIFYKRIVAEQGLPFELGRTTQQTIDAGLQQVIETTPIHDLDRDSNWEKALFSE
jgi:DNA-damage-inducible protein J